MRRSHDMLPLWILTLALMVWASSAEAEKTDHESAVAVGAEAKASPAQDLESAPLRPFLLGGIQTHELDHERWMAALHQHGMNAVQVTIYAHQGPWNTSELWYAEEEPAVLSEIRAARRNGQQVVLILRVALDHGAPENRHLWHGLIYPDTERATREWFRRYGDFVVKWARVAEREGVEVLGIASEMNSLAATLPIDELPGLALWYLDPESQQRLRDLVGRSESLFTEDLRMSMGAGDFEKLDDFLVQRNEAEKVWARAYTFAGAEDRLAAMNARRQLLDGLWRQLTARVRDVFSGRLTLAANFDNYHEVGFWDVLDLMGINAYFPLREALETPLSEDGLAQGWRQVFGDVGEFKEKHELDLPIVFTELGYTRWRGVTVAPWSSQGFIPMWDPEGDEAKDRAFFWRGQPIEPEERALALRALLRVSREPALDRADPEGAAPIRSAPDLAGVLYWKLSSDRDLARFEPFMLYLGEDFENPAHNDPALPALRSFSQGIRPFSPRGDGSQARLADAILQEDLASVKALVSESSGEERARLVQGALPLAVRLGRNAIIRQLLDLGATIDVPDASGFLPLHWACYQGDPELVELLVPATSSWRDALGETPLMKCARLDNVAVARQLIHRGEPQGVDRGVAARNLRQRSALHLAADQASVAMVELLASQASPESLGALDDHGMTALHLAARRGAAGIVEVLARGGQGHANSEGNRPASEAAIFGRAGVFGKLFDASTVKERNIYGQSLLHLAAHGGDVEILRRLLPHFDDVDVIDDDGWTPLAFATRNGQLEAVRMLLEKGASPLRKNQEGTAALHLAAMSREPWLIQEFLRLEIDVSLADGDGNSALHHAAGWGRLENIRQLLAAGASVRQRNVAGDTAIDVAEDSGRRRALLALQPTGGQVPQASD